MPETADTRVATCATVTEADADRLPDVALMFVTPLPTAVTRPPAVTVATKGSSLDHVTVALKGRWN